MVNAVVMVKRYVLGSRHGCMYRLRRDNMDMRRIRCWRFKCSNEGELQQKSSHSGWKAEIKVAGFQAPGHLGLKAWRLGFTGFV